MTLSPPVVAVTGATGALGEHVVSHVLAAGYSVRALVRHRVESRPGLTIVEGDLLDEPALRQLVDGARYVIHMAAQVPRSADHLIEDVNVRGTELLVEAARAAGVERICFFSSVSVYGCQRGTLDEVSAPKPQTRYARTKLEAERVCLAVGSPRETPLTIVLRLASVYGPGMKGGWLMLERAARAGWLPALSGGRRRALVHRDDVARATLVALTAPLVESQIFNVTDGNLYEPRDIVASVYDAVGRCARWRLPNSVLAAGVFVLRPIRWLLPGSFARGVEALHSFVFVSAVSGERFMRATAFRPAVDLQASVIARVRPA